MAFVLDEDAYEAELIDEFDAPDALLQQDETHQPVAQNKQQAVPPPFVSAQSLRHQSILLEHAPMTHTQSAGVLYPSFQELNGGIVNVTSSSAPSLPAAGALATQPPPLSPLQHLEHRYPRVESSYVQQETTERRESSPYEAPRGRMVRANDSNDVPSSPYIDAPVHSADPCGRSTHSRSTASEPQKPVQAKTEPLPMLSEQEFEVKQREIAQELQGYEQQLDYLARALAGDTPHQVEERKRREHERQEREHQRLITMESRVQHQIERAHERDQRRVKVHERAHRASRSPSPEMRKEESEEGEVVPQGEF